MNLHLKYRPSAIDEIFGNYNLVQSLSAMLEESESFPHSVLLTGQTGCGKTTIARIIANELGCKGTDYREIDTADFRGIDTVREIRKVASYKPIEGVARVWVIDECHQLSKDAQNAFLKMLEDTPKHCYFILCTTEPNKLINTIPGRCSQFQVNPLSDSEMRSLLKFVVKSEGDKLTSSVYDQIQQDSLGLPRNALQVLNQVLQAEPEDRKAVAHKAAEERSESIALCRALLNGEPWKKVRGILDGLKEQEPEQIRRHIIGYAQSVLLSKENSQAAHIIEEFWEPLYNIGFPGLVYCCYSVIKS